MKLHNCLKYSYKHPGISHSARKNLSTLWNSCSSSNLLLLQMLVLPNRDIIHVFMSKIPRFHPARQYNMYDKVHEMIPGEHITIHYALCRGLGRSEILRGYVLCNINLIKEDFFHSILDKRKKNLPGSDGSSM